MSERDAKESGEALYDSLLRAKRQEFKKKQKRKMKILKAKGLKSKYPVLLRFESMPSMISWPGWIEEKEKMHKKSKFGSSIAGSKALLVGDRSVGHHGSSENEASTTASTPSTPSKKGKKKHKSESDLNKAREEKEKAKSDTELSTSKKDKKNEIDREKKTANGDEKTKEKEMKGKEKVTQGVASPIPIVVDSGGGVGAGLAGTPTTTTTQPKQGGGGKGRGGKFRHTRLTLEEIEAIEAEAEKIDCLLFEDFYEYYYADDVDDAWGLFDKEGKGTSFASLLCYFFISNFSLNNLFCLPLFPY